MTVISLTSAAQAGLLRGLVAHPARRVVPAADSYALLHLTRAATSANLQEIASGLQDTPRTGTGDCVQYGHEDAGGYDFAVVDGRRSYRTSAGEGSLARQLRDGILIAVRVGRPESAADAAMMRTLKRAGARIVGVVAAEAQAIADFGSAST